MAESTLIVVVLHASDLERSAAFYRNLIGVPLSSGINEPRNDPWIGGLRERFIFEGTDLHFTLVPARPPQRPVTTGVQIGFRVPDLAAVHRRLVAADTTVLHPPREEPWGWTARYLDPDGNVVGVGEAASRRPPQNDQLTETFPR